MLTTSSLSTNRLIIIPGAGNTILSYATWSIDNVEIVLVDRPGYDGSSLYDDAIHDIKTLGQKVVAVSQWIGREVDQATHPFLVSHSWLISPPFHLPIHAHTGNCCSRLPRGSSFDYPRPFLRCLCRPGDLSWPA